MTIPGAGLIGSFLVGVLVPVSVNWVRSWKESASQKTSGYQNLHRKLLFICATSLLSGLLVLVFAEYVNTTPWEKPLRDIGGAFLAAAIIGFIVELSETRDFFKNLVAEFVTGMDFLHTLSSEELVRHGQLSLSEMLGRTIGSRENASSLVQPIFDSLLPHLQGVYRENFNVVMKVHVLSTKEELTGALTKLSGRDITVEALSGPVYMIEVTYCYDLLRPQEQQMPFNGSLWVECRAIEGLQLDLHARCVVKLDGTPQDLPLKSSRKGLLHQFSGEYEVPPGQMRVNVEVHTWQLEASRSLFTMQMISLTKGLTFTFSCKHDVYPILDLFGLGGAKSNVRSDDPNVVTFAKPDFIMLPGHGFSVSWSPEGLTIPRSARTSQFVGGGSLAIRSQSVSSPPQA